MRLYLAIARRVQLHKVRKPTASLVQATVQGRLAEEVGTARLRTYPVPRHQDQAVNTVQKPYTVGIALEEIMFEVDEDGNCESVTLGYGDA